MPRGIADDLESLIWNSLVIAAISLAFFLLHRILQHYSVYDIRTGGLGTRRT
ncbi:hypothetical protein FHT86_000932 [Rhizobium sp. BK313]|nr:hypothetical protein [Rhizobium sp. BK313]